MSTEIGKVFEKQLENAFRILKETHCLGWHKLPDSASTGGAFVGEQPSDYLLACPPGTPSFAGMFFVEAKASETHKKLQMSMLRPAQRGAISYYCGLLQIPYLVLFWDVRGQRIECWTGTEALSRKRNKKPLWVMEDISVGRKLRHELVAQLLARSFALPAKEKTLRLYGETQ